MPGRSQIKTRNERAMTPLWVISLFLSLCEVVTGIAVTKAVGNIQVAFTAFAIAYPLLVATAFFIVLWYRPYVFYSPNEFGAQTDVTKYVDAMRRREESDVKTVTLIRSAVNEAFASPQVIGRVEKMLASGEYESRERVTAVLKDVGDVAWQSVEKSFITIDPTPIAGVLGQIRQVPYDPEQHVGEFLDDVWFSLNGKMAPYRYAEKWIVRDTNSGFELRDAGRKWAADRGEQEDFRPLREVGIKAGMNLQAIRI